MRPFMHIHRIIITQRGGSPFRLVRENLIRKARGLIGAGLVAAGLLVAGCLGGGGSGSETTLAGITGKVVDTDGKPLEGAAVHIRPEGALSSGRLGMGGSGEDPAAAYTKADGTFLVEGLAAGDYYVECRASGGAALLQASVKDTLVRLPDAVLRPTGALRGRIAGPAEGQAELVGASVFITGLPGQAFLPQIFRDTVGFILGDIPAGIYTVVARPGYIGDLARFKVLELPAVRIGSGDTTDLGIISLPLREGPEDSAYLKDSSALAALNEANGIEDWSSGIISGVTGDRISLLFSMGGSVLTRMTPDLEALDRVDYLNFQAPYDSAVHILAGASEFARLHDLRTLGIMGYRLEGDLEWLRSLSNLEEISLGLAGLKAFPRAVEDLPFLNTLYIGGDSLGSVPATVGKMKQLRYLGFEGASLAGLPSELAGLRNLRKLYLGGNRFASLPPVLLAMDSLRVLDLHDNQLASLPQELMALPALRGFNIRGNRLCGLSQEWKDWLKNQDSLWYSQQDTTIFKLPKGTVDSGWEAGQHCAGP